MLTLGSVKRYMQMEKVAHMPDLLRHFRTDALTLKPLLDHWARKGCLRPYQPSQCGKSCTQCEPALRQAFEWCQPIAE